MAGTAGEGVRVEVLVLGNGRSFVSGNVVCATRDILRATAQVQTGGHLVGQVAQTRGGVDLVLVLTA